LKELEKRVDWPPAVADAVQESHVARLEVESSEASGAFDILATPERALGPIV